ncbi:radial spoke protein 3-domain-containing protein [Blyttiomyces helicus]|uniref:Radial spoke protein 3-domain-containing protein n=1 Tax=Blyttiomyces helicus TaxID=388810 RepID=A0A4P9WNQ3_9FUNG|nr:radial spoke protein 3-domain-containing protein [Blyttiomyces helicus]|eukprot:RKO93328.1 radial spoke protein 3-domain-containing protein [Blyttiomyces helicus]
MEGGMKSQCISTYLHTGPYDDLHGLQIRPRGRLKLDHEQESRQVEREGGGAMLSSGLRAGKARWGWRLSARRSKFECHVPSQTLDPGARLRVNAFALWTRNYSLQSEKANFSSVPDTTPTEHLLGDQHPTPSRMQRVAPFLESETMSFPSEPALPTLPKEPGTVPVRDLSESDRTSGSLMSSKPVESPAGMTDSDLPREERTTKDGTKIAVGEDYMGRLPHISSAHAVESAMAGGTVDHFGAPVQTRAVEEVASLEESVRPTHSTLLTDSAQGDASNVNFEPLVVAPDTPKQIDTNSGIDETKAPVDELAPATIQRDKWGRPVIDPSRQSRLGNPVNTHTLWAESSELRIIGQSGGVGSPSTVAVTRRESHLITPSPTVVMHPETKKSLQNRSHSKDLGPTKGANDGKPRGDKDDMQQRESAPTSGHISRDRNLNVAHGLAPRIGASVGDDGGIGGPVTHSTEKSDTPKTVAPPLSKHYPIRANLSEPSIQDQRLIKINPPEPTRVDEGIEVSTTGSNKMSEQPKTELPVLAKQSSIRANRSEQSIQDPRLSKINGGHGVAPKHDEPRIAIDQQTIAGASIREDRSSVLPGVSSASDLSKPEPRLFAKQFSIRANRSEQSIQDRRISRSPNSFSADLLRSTTPDASAKRHKDVDVLKVEARGSGKRQSMSHDRIASADADAEHREHRGRSASRSRRDIADAPSAREPSREHRGRAVEPAPHSDDAGSDERLAPRSAPRESVSTRRQSSAFRSESTSSPGRSLETVVDRPATRKRAATDAGVMTKAKVAPPASTAFRSAAPDTLKEKRKEEVPRLEKKSDQKRGRVDPVVLSDPAEKEKHERRTERGSVKSLAAKTQSGHKKKVKSEDTTRWATPFATYAAPTMVQWRAEYARLRIVHSLNFPDAGEGKIWVMVANRFPNQAATHNRKPEIKSLLPADPEARLNKLTALAAEKLGSPCCVLSIVDEETVCWKSAFWGGTHLPAKQKETRSESLASVVVQDSTKSGIVVLDAKSDQRCINAFPAREGLEFFAGVPILFISVLSTNEFPCRLRDGYVIGVLSISGPARTHFLQMDMTILQRFGAWAAGEIGTHAMRQELDIREEMQRARARLGQLDRQKKGDEASNRQLIEEALRIIREGLRSVAVLFLRFSPDSDGLTLDNAEAGALVMDPMPPSAESQVDADLSKSIETGAAALVWSHRRPSAVLLAFFEGQWRTITKQESLFLSSCANAVSSIWERAEITEAFRQIFEEWKSLSRALTHAAPAVDDARGLTPAVCIIEPLMSTAAYPLKTIPTGTDEATDVGDQLGVMSARESLEMLVDFSQMCEVLAKKHELRSVRNFGNLFFLTADVGPGTGTCMSLAALAIELQATLRTYQQTTKVNVRARVGMHCDFISSSMAPKPELRNIWSGIANFAYTLECLAEDGIVVSEAFYRATKEAYEFQALDPVYLQGQGCVTIFTLEGHIPEAAPDEAPASDLIEFLPASSPTELRRTIETRHWPGGRRPALSVVQVPESSVTGLHSQAGEDGRGSQLSSHTGAMFQQAERPKHRSAVATPSLPRIEPIGSDQDLSGAKGCEQELTPGSRVNNPGRRHPNRLWLRPRESMLASPSAAPALPKGGQMQTTASNFDPTSTRQQGAEAYSFASEPRPVQAPRKKYRDPTESDAIMKSPSVNIMYDRRIHRGNTYASPTIPLHAQPDPLEVQKQNDLKRRIRARRRAEAQRRVRTPDPVDGRKHIDIQTDLYLEELTDKVPEAFAATQTDAFLDRAPSPLYIPQKSGVDVATQVYDGELFDFDYEVAPILEILVGKTIEQALMEVHEEEELELLRRHQLAFEERRNAELAEVQRMEDAERRRTEEKERRVKEQIMILKEKQEVAEKIAARAFAQSYLQNLVPTVFDSLSTNGYFYDAVEKEVETLFLPWLNNQVDRSIQQEALASHLVDDIIRNAVRTMRNDGVPPPDHE